MAYQRKTVDCYAIEGNCGYGWDVESMYFDMEHLKESMFDAGYGR